MHFAKLLHDDEIQIIILRNHRVDSYFLFILFARSETKIRGRDRCIEHLGTSVVHSRVLIGRYLPRYFLLLHLFEPSSSSFIDIFDLFVVRLSLTLSTYILVYYSMKKAA